MILWRQTPDYPGGLASAPRTAADLGSLCLPPIRPSGASKLYLTPSKDAVERGELGFRVHRRNQPAGTGTSRGTGSSPPGVHPPGTALVQTVLIPKRPSQEDPIRRSQSGGVQNLRRERNPQNALGSKPSLFLNKRLSQERRLSLAPVPAALPSHRPHGHPRTPCALSRATAPNPLRARPLFPPCDWSLSLSVRRLPSPLGEAAALPRPRRYRLGRAESK